MAVGASYLASVMKAAGLTASFYNDEVTDLIEQARADMARSGIVSYLVVDESDYLVKGAIKTFVKAEKAESSEESERLFESYRLQVESMSKSSFYRGDINAV